MLRHALRFGVLTAAAVAVQRLWDPPFGYWIPLTVSVVLKPYAGTTLVRGAQRLTGTVAGVAVGIVISGIISSWAAQAVAVATEFLRRGPHRPASVVQQPLLSGQPFEQIPDLRLTDGYRSGESRLWCK